MILPPAKIGIFGSGQLGRMFAQEAIQMGYEVIVYSPETNSPASKVGAREITGGYEDLEKVHEFIESVEAVSFEFENIPTKTIEYLIQLETSKRKNFFCPSPKAILIAQNRILEKEFFQSCGIPTVPYKPIFHFQEDCSGFPFPAILKTNRFGYDGKGQRKFATYSEWEQFVQSQPQGISGEWILEAYYPYDLEISVIYARDFTGKEFIFPPAKNTHKNHILDTTEFPAPVSEKVHNQAIGMASILGRSLDYVGVLGLEFFVQGEEVVANEFAPRPHNSGHYTQDASLISQFGLQLRTLTLQSLPDENQIRPCIMKNFIGKKFLEALPLVFDKMQKDSRYYFHNYQKEEAREGRKMGHVNFLGSLSEFDKNLRDL